MNPVPDPDPDAVGAADTEFKEGCEIDEFVFKEVCEFAFLMLSFRFVKDLRLPWDLEKVRYDFPPSTVVLVVLAGCC